MDRNIYIIKLQNQLHRLLSLYDLNPYSKTRGYGDRLHWGWKLIDFSNGTFQGGIHSLSIMIKLGFFTEDQKTNVIEWIHWIIEAIEKSRYKNGSLVEAFPYENSFCVTALVAFDLLSAIINLDKEWNEKGWALSVAEPLINFISRHDETHGFISNHLSTAAAAINKWNVLSGDNNRCGEKILQKIMEKRSPEGWYLEYEGPDPGYQTLCTYYLADYYHYNPDHELLSSLEKSIEFLSYFVHPDGTIGGEYGSRNTEVYYPAGFEILKSEIPLARAIAFKMRRSIEENRTVTIEAIDQWNFIPMLNSYAVAALFANDNRQQEQIDLPCEQCNIDKFFPHAQIRVHGNVKYYAIVGASKGGVIKIYDKQKRQIIWDDGGYIGTSKRYGKVSTQFWYADRNIINDTESIEIESPFFKVACEYLTPIRFIFLRILNVTIMRISILGDMVKKILVKMLITKKEMIPAIVIRTVSFEDDGIKISDEIRGMNVRFQCLESGRKFTTIHMASSGYFQNQQLARKESFESIDVEQLNSSKLLKKHVFIS